MIKVRIESMRTKRNKRFVDDVYWIFNFDLFPLSMKYTNSNID